MSAAIIPDEGMALFLSKLEYTSNVKLKLFTDNVTISKSTVYANLTTECSFPGYPSGGASLTWGSITVGGDGTATNVATAVTFTRSTTGSSQTAKVWAVVDTSANKILFARNPGDQVFATAGDSFTVTLTGKEGDLP